MRSIDPLFVCSGGSSGIAASKKYPESRVCILRIIIGLGLCSLLRGQRQHSCFPPSSPGFELELERAQARARRPGLNAKPAIHKPKARKARAQFAQKPAGFFESPIRPDYAELLIFLLIYLIVGLNKRLKHLFPKHERLWAKFSKSEPDPSPRNLSPFQN